MSEMVKPDEKARNIASVKSTLEVCVRTKAFLEYMSVNGKEAQHMSNSLQWLTQVRQGLEMQLEELEKSK